jgi:hypothetical protein
MFRHAKHASLLKRRGVEKEQEQEEEEEEEEGCLPRRRRAG